MNEPYEAARTTMNEAPLRATPPSAPGDQEPPPDIFVLPTSFVQRRLWFLEQMEPGAAVYNTPFAYRLSGRLDLPALERSFNEIVHRHEVLRTTFATEDDTVVQRIASRLRLTVPLVDLRHRGVDDEELQQLLNKEARRPFDLARGPLIRVIVFRLAPDDHVLSFTSHHTVFDGWSEGVLLRELQALYEAFRHGRSSPLSELPIQYADYAVWQHDQLPGPELEKQLAYWKRRLAGLGVLDLPADRPRPKMQTYRGAVHPISIAPATVAQLKAVGVHDKATPFMVLAAALLTLLHRYSGQDDLSIGFTASGRDRSELEPLIGCFVKTLVLRGDLSADPTFGQLLARVRDAALGAYAHQDLPFERLVEAFPERDTSRSPLFQVLLVQGPMTRETTLGDLAVRPTPVHAGIAKFDLTLTLAAEDDREGLDGLLEYNTDLFETDSIDRLTDHYLTLLDGIAARPGSRLSEFPLLTEPERAAQNRWNATAAPYPDACVHDLIAAQASRTPERIAVEYERRSLTYEELEQRANHLARRLRAHGVGLGSRVGAFMERGPEMLVAVLGVLKAGGAYVPLDPAFPRERLTYMVEDSGATVLLTHGMTDAALPSRRIPAVRVGGGGPEADLNSLARPDDLAYVIYTSGSTGRPKGVAVTHRSLVNLLESMARAPGLVESDVLLSVTTLSFDIAALELYLPLIKGARVVLASRDETLDGVRLQARLATAGATLMQGTPATWRLLLETNWRGQPGLRALCGGEALSRDLAEALLSRVGELWNMYGPTETTVWSSVSRVGPGNGPVSIGRPIANTQLWVLDAHQELLPVGVPGELYIGGVGVARGYWERPELTAQRFVTDRLSRVPEARLYRTGDLARRLRDGSLECLGRLDHQVKVRGFRIELGEIEAALRECPGVTEAVVVVQEAGGDQHLVAFLTGTSVEAAAVRARLGAWLPAYMVPAKYAFLDALPLTPNGKVDRKTLTRFDAGTGPRSAAYVAPRTATEKTVAAIWADALQLERLGVEEDFFDLGGHSLLAVRTIARIRDALGADLKVRAIFEHPTVAGIAELVDLLAVSRVDSIGAGDATGREEFEV